MNNRYSDELDASRKEIDRLDAQISELLEKRMDLVSEIADLKSKLGLAVLDASRENSVLEKIRASLSNSDYEESILSVFKYIIKTSREFQEGKTSRTNSPDIGNMFGLIGEKLSHSLSPRIHSLVYNKCRIRGSYNLIEVPHENLPKLVGKLREEGYSGFNVTVPYKKEIMKYLDSVSEEAMRVGAVNTVSLVKHSVGYNTDYHGFGLSLEKSGFNPARKKCAILGSGGSAHAVVAYLEDHQASDIVIVTRDTEAALFKFPGLSCQDIKSFSASGFDAVINTTPVGMYPNVSASPISKEQLAGAEFVMDLIYNPVQTVFLKYASELGIPYSNGLYMLVAQAILAEEIWLGRKMDQDLIISIFEETKKSL